MLLTKAKNSEWSRECIKHLKYGSSSQKFEAVMYNVNRANEISLVQQYNVCETAFKEIASHYYCQWKELSKMS
uniref:Uncharacterized protein n=1 Tax=Anguilla anguilla TaxID=7936 RepID=A0A0E9WVT4_ANGAN